MERMVILNLVFITFAILTLGTAVLQVGAQTSSLVNSWISKSPMPTERIYLGAATVNGVIYAMGGIHYQMVDGRSTQAPTNVNEAYDPVLDAWTSKAPMPTPLTKFGIAAYQNKIYCISGTTNEVYDTSKDTWQTGSPMISPRTDVKANVVNGKIYLLGGKIVAADGSELFSTLNEVYDPTTDAWTAKTAMPLPAPYYTAAVVGNKIYVISGTSREDSTTLSNAGAVQVYDTQLDCWSNATSIPVPVNNAAAAAVSISAPNQNYEDPDAVLLVTGGTTSNDPFHASNLTQIYYPHNNTWTVGVSLLYPRAALAAVSIDSTVYALGGGQHALFNPQSNINQQYGPDVIQTPNNASTTPMRTSTPNPSPSLSPSSSTNQPIMTPSSSPSHSPTHSTSSPATQQPTLEPTETVSLTPIADPSSAPLWWLILLTAVICVIVIALGLMKLAKKK